MNIKQAVPFFMVSDMEASLRFYVEGLGFTMQNSWVPADKIEWCWLQRDGAALMLQQFRIKPDKPYLAGDKPGAGVSVYFICEDALNLYHEFILNKITVNEPFVGNNMWDVALNDPDGYSLHFESATDVPEETTYSEWLSTKQ